MADNYIRQARQLLKTNMGSARHAQETQTVLEGWRAPIHAQVAALLLPLIRQGLGTDGLLAEQFGPQPETLARKVCRLLYDPPQLDPARTLQQLYTHAYTDRDVVLLGVAAHVARASQLNDDTELEQHAWAERTTAIFLPLLNLLGMEAYRNALANLSLSLQDIDKYEALARQSDAYYRRNEGLYDRLWKTLVEAMGFGRQQVMMHEITPADLHEDPHTERPLTIDLLVNDLADCYAALGDIHRRWRPRTDSAVVDKIAAPQINGYRTLQTTVLCEHDGGMRPVEFNIRTFDIERVNGYGVVATGAKEVEAAWWNDKHLLKKLCSNTDLCVFLPDGFVLSSLPAGSTVLDVAFRVHSAKGPYAHQFYLNGQSVPPNQRVRHRDLVTIHFDEQYPSLQPQWESMVQTKTARKNIKRFLRKDQRAPQRGREQIEKVLERESLIYNMRLPNVDAGLAQLAKQHGYPTVEALYLGVGDGKVAPDELVAEMIEWELREHIALASGEHWPHKRVRIARTWMQEHDKFSRKHRVLPGVPIVGRYRSEGGQTILVVHRADSKHAPPKDNAVPLQWRAAKEERETIEIHVTASQRKAATSMVVRALYSTAPEGTRTDQMIHELTVDTRDGNVRLHALVDVGSKAQRDQLKNEFDRWQREGYIYDYNLWHLFPGQKMHLAGKADKRGQNPYSLKQVRDQRMFFGREAEVNSIIEHVQDRQPCIVLYGQKRIGKTSLLYQLSNNILPQQTEEVVPVMFDALSLDPFTPEAFLLTLANKAEAELHRLITRPEHRRGLRLRERDLLADASPYVAFAKWTKRVQKQLQGRRLLFVIDEFTKAEEECDAGRLDRAFFQGLHHLTGTVGVGFLFCVHDNIYRQTSHCWELLQRGQPIRLGSLEKSAAAQLVRRPLDNLYEFEDDVVERILDLTNCHPYFMQAICAEVTKRMSQQPYSRVTLDDLYSAMAFVLRTGDHYFNHYRGHTDHLNWETLKTIAYLAGDDNGWVEGNAIREALAHIEQSSHLISNALGDLYRAGIIESRNEPQRTLYRIPVGLFQLWLKQGTHPLVNRDPILLKGTTP